MALTTYAELQAAIASWLDRTDLEARITEFIALAEVRLNRDPELRIMPMETRHRLTTIAATPYLQLPARYQGMLSVRFDGTRLQFRSATMLDQSGEYVGDTAYWTIEADQLRLIPQSGSGNVVELICYQGFVPLSDSNTSNWWMDNAPDLLLYASLLEAEPFLKNDERLVTWGTMVDRGIENLTSADRVNRYGSNMEMVCG